MLVARQGQISTRKASSLPRARVLVRLPDELRQLGEADRHHERRRVRWRTTPLFASRAHMVAGHDGPPTHDVWQDRAPFSGSRTRR
jgi:hypothetical protein